MEGGINYDTQTFLLQACNRKLYAELQHLDAVKAQLLEQIAQTQGSAGDHLVMGDRRRRSYALIRQKRRDLRL